VFINPRLFSVHHSYISELTENYYPLDQEQAAYPNGSTLISCFLHHGLGNLHGQPKYKNTSIRIISRWEHQNRSTIQTGLQAILMIFKEKKEERKQLPSQCFCKVIKNT